MLNEILYLNPSKQHSNVGVANYGTEADRAYEVACEAKKYADSKNLFKAVYVSGPNLTLSQAIADSNAKGATIHVDIHTDAEGLPEEIRGCTALYKSDKGKKLAEAIYKAVSAITPTNDRGIKYRADLGCLNQTNAVAMLIELIFHTSPQDVAFFNSHVSDLAKAVIDGVLAYCGEDIGVNIVREGWRIEDGKWYHYFNGEMTKNDWKKDSSDRWFYLGPDGAMVTNCFEKDSTGNWFYLGEDGAMVTNKKLVIGDDGAIKLEE